MTEINTIENLGKHFAAFASAAEERITKAADTIDDVKGRVTDLERRGARERDVTEAPVSWGSTFIESKKQEIEALAKSTKGSVGLSLKALTTGTTSGGPLTQPYRDSTTMMPRRRLTVRDLLSVVSIASGSVEYARQTARATGAAAVAEGAAKPESSLAFELVTLPTRVIAHWTKASRQILDDAPQLGDMIDVEMRSGLALAEEGQLLLGSGSGQNLTGLVPAATAFSDPTGIVSPTMLDKVSAGILQVNLADFEANGIVLHPTDWTKIGLLKDAGGNYILGNPGETTEPRLFGLPVVRTSALPAGHFLIGDFAAAATLYDRWEPRVEVGFELDDFTKNLVTILAEERLALAIRQSAALVYGTF